MFAHDTFEGSCKLWKAVMIKTLESVYVIHV